MLLLVPIYLAVGFAVGQVLRERTFEENYAHKASIAKTLPSYSELIGSQAVKDEVMSSATKVVFSTPFPEKKAPKNTKKNPTDELKELVEIFLSLIHI